MNIHQSTNSPNTQSCISVSLKSLFGDLPVQLNLKARAFVTTLNLKARAFVTTAASIRLIIFPLLVPPPSDKREICPDERKMISVLKWTLCHVKGVITKTICHKRKTFWG